jgi:hypothetical protein
MLHQGDWDRLGPTCNRQIRLACTILRQRLLYRRDDALAAVGHLPGDL